MVQIIMVKLTYRDPGTPDFPTSGVFNPELNTEVPIDWGERLTDKTGLIAPELIGGFGGVEIGSGTMRDCEN